MRDFVNEKEVMHYMEQTKRKVIIFEGSVYDVTEYLGQHPGGSDQIEPYLGGKIDEAFKDAGHTKSARLVFRDLEKVGIIAGDEMSKETVKTNVPNIKGLDGTLLESKLKIDYNRGMFW